MDTYKRLAFLILQSPQELAQLPGGHVLFFNEKNEICISYSSSIGGGVEILDPANVDTITNYIDILEATAEERAKYAEEAKTPLTLKVEHMISVMSTTLSSFGTVYLAVDESTGCQVVVLQRTSTGGTLLLTVVKDALGVENTDAVEELDAFANSIGEMVSYLKTPKNAETI